MSADESLLFEEQGHPASRRAAYRRAARHFFLGLGVGTFPLLIFIIGGILYQIDLALTLNNDLTAVHYASLWLFGVVCLATLVCLIIKKVRFIGWGLLLAVQVSFVAYMVLLAIASASLD